MYIYCFWQLWTFWERVVVKYWGSILLWNFSLQNFVFIYIYLQISMNCMCIHVVGSFLKCAKCHFGCFEKNQFEVFTLYFAFFLTDFENSKTYLQWKSIFLSFSDVTYIFWLVVLKKMWYGFWTLSNLWYFFFNFVAQDCPMSIILCLLYWTLDNIIANALENEQTNSKL